ncbi:hypothetical protein D3C84_1178420 [compost metagenome]
MIFFSFLDRNYEISVEIPTTDRPTVNKLFVIKFARVNYHEPKGIVVLRPQI